MNNTGQKVSLNLKGKTNLKNTRLHSKKWNEIKKHWRLYLIILPPLIYIVIFHYIPMYGIQIAFKDFRIMDGIFGSEWVGLKHFKFFFNSNNFSRLLANTAGLSVYSIIAGFFPPIILALGLNECRHIFFKKTVQMVTYAPHFLSTVIIVGIMMQVLSLNGVVNNSLDFIGISPIQFLGIPKLFKSIYVWSGIWQRMGYNSILYIATLSSVNPELYEAARVDGVNIWQKIWYIDIPSLMPTAVILLIVNSANILNIGFEKVFLMQNPLNMEVSDIISTYVYRVGLINMEYSFSTAVNLFQSLISLVLIVIVNAFAKRFSETSLW